MNCLTSSIPSEMKLQTQKFSADTTGPHLLITAGVHGDEYVPIQAVRELISYFQSHELIGGRLTLVPVVNESAFGLGRRCGEDGLDLARTCPGRVDGSATEQAAMALGELIRGVDAFIDLHSGGTELLVEPLAGYMLHPDEVVLAKQREMARAFDLPLVWGTSPEFDGRSLSVARDARVPAIYVEYLGGVGADSNGVEACVSGCLNVMGLLGMIERTHAGPNVVEVIEDGRTGVGHMQVCNLSPITGLFEPVVELGQDVNAGDLLGRVTDTFGAMTIEMVAEQCGKVVVLRGVPRVSRGESIGVIAERGYGS